MAQVLLQSALVTKKTMILYISISQIENNSPLWHAWFSLIINTRLNIYCLLKSVIYSPDMIWWLFEFPCKKWLPWYLRVCIEVTRNENSNSLMKSTDFVYLSVFSLIYLFILLTSFVGFSLNQHDLYLYEPQKVFLLLSW